MLEKQCMQLEAGMNDIEVAKIMKENQDAMDNLQKEVNIEDFETIN